MLDLSSDFLLEHLKNTDKPIVLYGMGNGADSILKRLEAEGISISGVFVSDGFVRDKVFHGFHLMSYSDMCRIFDDFIVLVAFGTNLPDVMTNIYRISAECELYAPYVPVIGEGTFDKHYLEAHLSDFEKLCSTLADDLSEKTLTSILNYRITGRIDYLRECETDTDEMYSLLNLTDDEVYADLGAYRGDTVDEFIAHTEGYRSIYAIEPDTKTFEKLKNHTMGMQNVHIINAAAYSHSRGVAFAVRGGRNSSLGGTVFTESVALDELFGSDKVTYIKMDIEGAECEAIDGAVRIIADIKPKLRIAAYHRIDDLCDITEKVLKINPTYRVYLRHRPYIPDWDTDLIFV